jgi:hypothetical protein
LVCRHFGADKIALDIDVADPASGAADLLQQVERADLLRLVRRKIGKHGKQLKLGFDAAGGGA